MVGAISFNHLATKEFERKMRKQFFEEGTIHMTTFKDRHSKEMGDELPLMGQPDDGNGVYFQAQGYGKWYMHAVVQRLHKNDAEHLVTLLPLSLVNGLCFPLLTTTLLVGYLAGRSAFSFGYIQPEGAFNQYRLIGSAGVNLSKVSTILVSLYLGIQLSRGKLLLHKALRML